MKKFRKFYSAILIGVTASMLFTGCGKEAAKSEDGKNIVRFMVGGAAGELEQYKKAVEAFNSQSKTTEVEFVGVPGDGYTEKLMTQLASKNAPDCFYSDENSFGELNKSEKLYDVTEFLSKEDSALKIEDIPESILAGYKYKGKINGVPVDCNPMLIYYNVDLFKELGIKTPQQYFEEGSWNFAALQSVSEQLRDASKVGFVYENWWGPLYSFLTSNGDQLYSEDLKTAYFDSERVEKGLTFLSQNIDSKAFTYAGALASGEAPDTLFMSGQAGMLYAGRWYVPSFKELAFKYDVVPFPYYEKPEEALASMPATPLVMNKSSKNPEAVWEFMSFYCGNQGQTIRIEGQGNAVPTIKGLDEIVLTGTPEHAQYFLDAVDISILYPQAEALNPGLSASITTEVEKLFVKDQDVAQTLKNIQDIAAKELTEE